MACENLTWSVDALIAEYGHDRLAYVVLLNLLIGRGCAKFFCNYLVK